MIIECGHGMSAIPVAIESVRRVLESIRGHTVEGLSAVNVHSVR